MSKKSNSVKSPVPADFSWAKESGFTPPQKKGESAAMHKILAPSLTHSGNLKPLLEKLLGSLIGTVNASAGIIRILAQHGQTMQLISSVGFPAELLEAENAAQLDCETDSNASGNDIYSANLSTCKSRQVCRHVGCQIQSLIATPIENQTSSKTAVGMLTLFFNGAPEQPKHISKTVMAYAQMLSAVIEHDKSNRDAKRADLIAERQAIANEIHDSLAQTLVYTRMRTRLLLESIRTGNELLISKYAHDIDEVLESSQKTVRELITDFRCAMDPSGLLNALQTLTGQFCQRNEIELEYINRVANLELPLEYEIQVYHIVREALDNISTHSGATHARLIFEHSGDYYVFTIEDNGSGGFTFTPVEGHYGMMIMRERAQRIGGEIKVESSKGIGTRVQLYFPQPGTDWREVNE